MQKRLLTDREDFDFFVRGYGPHTTPKTQLNYYMEPESFPCVVVYYEWDNPVGPLETECEYVYPQDFESHE